jgi:hypothetical protein
MCIGYLLFKEKAHMRLHFDGSALIFIQLSALLFELSQILIFSSVFVVSVS